MLIGIDFDSTLAQLDQVWIGRLNAKCGTSYNVNQWTDWDMSFLSEAERGIAFSLLTPDIYDDMPAYPGAREAVQQLASIEGVTLRCVTTNPSKNGEEVGAAKVRWLKRHILELSEGVIFARVKSGLGLSMLIDDAPHHFTEPDYIPVLVERPWNHMVSTPHSFRDWSDAYGVVSAAIASKQLPLPPSLAMGVEPQLSRALA